MKTIPGCLLTYMDGLREHDVDKIASALADDVRFVTPVRSMDKQQTLAFLAALYAGFPDWHYDNDPPEHQGGDRWAVKWRQGGTHTAVLDLPGFPAVAPTRRTVSIPAHYFYYRSASDRLVEIHPDPVPGGAPRGIFEQIGIELPPL